jgi:GH25 family lysozyme M1 (1,4-beta-N-acetylmuramidase)
MPMIKNSGRRRRGFRAAVASALAVLVATFCAVAAHDASAGVTTTAAAGDPRPGGVDVSSYQPGFNWPQAAAQGIQFAYVKATQGITYRNPEFAAQYNGSYRAGMIRGAYHYARPDRSGGAAQADFFVQHGGAWSRDGRTLPGALDLENTTGVPYCYGQSATGMRTWIHDFVARYYALTGRWAVLYTRANWWNTCTGMDASFAAISPLWLASFGSVPGPMPSGWRTYSFWQRGLWSGVDFETWNGSYERLKNLACNGAC